MNFLWAIAIMIASSALQMLLTPKPKTPKPASLTDFDFPQFEEDTAQIVVFGDVWITDWMVLWFGAFRTKKIKSKGKKK